VFCVHYPNVLVYRIPYEPALYDEDERFRGADQSEAKKCFVLYVALSNHRGRVTGEVEKTD